MIRLAAAASLLSLLAGLAACEAPPPPEVTLRIAALQTQDSLPYYVMREQGFDRKYGLTFTESRLESSAALVEAMAQDAIDVSFAGIVPLLAEVLKENR